MKLIIKEKNIKEQSELSSHKFDKKELSVRAEQLDLMMQRLATPLQEKVPLQVAQEYFSTYGSEAEKAKVAKFVDDEGLVRIADIFVMAKIYNNVDLNWHLDKYNEE